jgi:hypothetical protein
MPLPWYWKQTPGEHFVLCDYGAESKDQNHLGAGGAKVRSK